MLKVSPDGVVKIRQREGCVLRAYRDSVGVWTIGAGHTGRMSGVAVTAGMVITQAQADAFLVDDLAPVEAAIAAHVGATLTQHQVDALASLAFNIGVSGFIGSTVVHKLNTGDVRGAADAFLMWEKPAALKSRREAERAQFLTGDVGATVSKSETVRSAPVPKSICAPAIVGPKIDISSKPPCARTLCPLRKVA